MARPDCPRCDSDLVVPVPSDAPSEHVLELRDGKVPAVALEGAPAHWLCRSCGHRWEPEIEEPVGGSGSAGVDADRPEADAARLGTDTGRPDPEDAQQVEPQVPALDLSGFMDPEDAGAPPQEGISRGEGATTLGSTLRRAREESGRSIQEAAKGTRIWERHLLALESDAPLEEFPAPPYARFFLREYAEFLRLEPAPLLREFDARHAPVDEPPLEPLPDPRVRRKVAARILAALSVTALLVIALERPGSDPVSGPSLGSRAGAVAVHDSAHVPLTPPPVREPSGLRVVLRPVQPCWVQVVSDGEVVASLTLLPGDPVVYRAREELRLRLGNAGGVRLRVNGERLETGSAGEVVTFAFRFDDGEILTERS